MPAKSTASQNEIAYCLFHELSDWLSELQAHAIAQYIPYVIGMVQ